MDAAQLIALFERVIADFTAYFSALNADRRANPRDDLATIIANAEFDGTPIGELEAMSYYIIVATAGHDTASSTTSTIMWALATVPGLLDRVRSDLSLIPQLVEEGVRWSTPVKHFMRTATEDVEIRGRSIRKSDWLMLCYLSGNRDEVVFEAPERFDIDRRPIAQLVFGVGAHSCLGQHLARMEIRQLLEAILPRLKVVSLSGEPSYAESIFVSGLKTLPIQFEMN